jgi:hypothetical protein
MTRANQRPATLTQEQADKLVAQVFRIDGRVALDRAKTVGFPPNAIHQAIRIIDGAEDGLTDIGKLATGWISQEVGDNHRPGTFSTRTMLIVMLMHVFAKEDLTMTGMAHTLNARLTAEQRELIGAPVEAMDADVFHRRLDYAHKLLLQVIDGYPYPKYDKTDPNCPPAKDRITRHRKLTAAQRVELAAFHEANADRITANLERQHDLMFELVANTVRIVGPLLEGNSGDIAMDATFTPIFGKNTNREDFTIPGRSTTLEAGLYRREGDHSVPEGPPTGMKRRKSVSKFGFETEVVTTTVGSGFDGPDVILAVSVHRPGPDINAPRILFPRVARLCLPVRNLSVDRLYNGLKVEDFHLIALRHGYELVFDYKSTDLGVQATYTSGMKQKTINGKVEWVRDKRAEVNDFIMCGGAWYLGFMPPLLIEAAARSRLDKTDPKWIDDAKLAELIDNRRKYQLKPIGGPDEDGYQLYALPPTDGYVAADPLSGELLPKPTAGRVKIPRAVGLKHQQRYPHLSPEWTEAYNLRGTVERTNNLLKHPTLSDLANPYRRQFRGHAATSLAVAMFAAVHNLNAADHYLAAAEGINMTGTRTRPTRPKQRPNGWRLQDIQKKRNQQEAA